MTPITPERRAEILAMANETLAATETYAAAIQSLRPRLESITNEERAAIENDTEIIAVAGKVSAVWDSIKDLF
jgi:hypothetical protein